jgi:hypothetical protein
MRQLAAGADDPETKQSMLKMADRYEILAQLCREEADPPENPTIQLGEANINEGKPWSEMDVFDLKNSLERSTPIADIADFLCRSEQEVLEKIADFGWSQRGPNARLPKGR